MGLLSGVLSGGDDTDLDFDAGEDIEKLGVSDNITTVEGAVWRYGNAAYHWTKTKATRDLILKKGLGSTRYNIESHEVPEAYTELRAASRRALVKKYGSLDAVMEDGQLDVERLYKKDNPTWVRTWITKYPLPQYGEYGVRIRLKDFFNDLDPWGLAVDDNVYGMGLTLERPIPPEYLAPVDAKDLE